MSAAAKAKHMVEVWASAADALLQEWYAKGLDNDRLGTALASVRLAQLGLMMTTYFKEVGQDFLEGETELRAANEAVKQFADGFHKRISDTVDSAEPDSVRGPLLN